jgi:hypothetical protein
MELLKFATRPRTENPQPIAGMRTWSQERARLEKKDREIWKKRAEAIKIEDINHPEAAEGTGESDASQ